MFGEGSLDRLGDLARELGFTRTLVVSDAGIVATGQVARATSLLEASGITATVFHDFDANPDTRMIDAGRAIAADARCGTRSNRQSAQTDAARIPTLKPETARMW